MELNLVLGILLVMILLFISTLGMLTYCVMESFEKETSELGNSSDDEESTTKPEKETTIDIDGNPIADSDDEEFVFWYLNFSWKNEVFDQIIDNSFFFAI